MQEITGPVVGITLVLSSVFIPTAFMPGLTGQFFRQFALTIAFSAILSATNVLTTLPAVAAFVLKPHRPQEKFKAEQRRRLPHSVGGMPLLLFGATATFLAPITVLSPQVAWIPAEKYSQTDWRSRRHVGHRLSFLATIPGWFLAGPVQPPAGHGASTCSTRLSIAVHQRLHLLGGS